MGLQDYRLLEQLHVATELVAYRAEPNGGGAEVEIWMLRGDDADAKERLFRRLRLAAIVDYPRVRSLVEFAPDKHPQYAILSAKMKGQSLADALQGQLPIGFADAVECLRILAETLCEVHKIGLAVGNLTESTIRLADEKQLQIDPLGTYDWSTDDTADDILQLGQLFLWLTNDAPGELAVLLSEMLVSDPAERPSASTVADLATEQLERIRSETDTKTLEMSETQIVSAELEDDSENEMSATVSISGADVSGKFDAAEPADMDGSDDMIFFESDLDESSEFSKTVQATPPKKRGSTKRRKKRKRSHDLSSTRPLLGRFRLIDKLGEGGMGEVYKAEDPIDTRIVAIKVLRAELTQDEESLKRFHKEARLLAEVNNPYVANLLEVNEDDGIHFMAVEFVPGRDLAGFLKEVGSLTEKQGVSVVADVARALMQAHDIGIVHRDLKPENILLLSHEDDTQWKVKLTDFGLARHTDETKSLNLTAAGTVLGTPMYMSPEQCSGITAVDARADVYSLGATLFHLLAGHPPFKADTVVGLITKHVNEPAPSVRKSAEELSEAVEQVIAKCLSKSPEARYQNATELLADLESIQRGEPTNMFVHPRLPSTDSDAVLTFDFEWKLNGSPEQLWPHVSNTERLNRAIGLPAPKFTRQDNEAGGTNVQASFRKMGMTIAWQEHPFEWIEGRQFGVLREYSEGPVKWFSSVVELQPIAGGGTTLRHQLKVLPANFIGKTAAKIEVGIKTKRSLEQVYRRIDAVVTGQFSGKTTSIVDPFEDTSDISSEKRRQLNTLLDRVIAAGVDGAVVERFGEYLAHAADQDVARIRPIALARRLALDPEQVIAACLHGTREGLLLMLWDILCPLCRIPSEVKDTLKLVNEHGHCDACNLDYELDFANSIELIFRASPVIRNCETGVFCVGGPAHSPHVVAQVRVAPNERFELDLALTEGAYRLRGPQLPFVFDFRIESNSRVSRLELNLSHGPDPELTRSLKTESQLLALTNDGDYELVVRVERVASRADAMTAARAASNPLFRELFPGECLSPGQLISVENVALLTTQLENANQLYLELGDSRAFERIHEHFRKLNELVRRESGTFVKTTGEGIVASFHDPVGAARAAMAMRELDESQLRVVVHRGPAMVATLNDQLDYFGTMVNTTNRLLSIVEPGHIHITSAVIAHEQVDALLQVHECTADIVDVDCELPADLVVHRVVPIRLLQSSS